MVRLVDPTRHDNVVRRRTEKTSSWLERFDSIVQQNRRYSWRSKLSAQRKVAVLR